MASSDTLTCDDPAVGISTSTNAISPSFSWTGPGSFTSNLSSPIVTVAGVYSVIVTAGNTGCLAFTSIIIPIDTAPPSITITGGTLTCAQPIIQLIAATSTVTSSFSWTGPGGFNSNTANPFASLPGNYTVTATNITTGCTASATVQVLADTLAPGATALGGLLYCNSTVQLHGSSPTPNAHYTWTGPTGEIFTIPNPVVSYAGPYTLTVAAPNGCTSTALAIVNGSGSVSTHIHVSQITDDQNGQGIGAIDITISSTPAYTVAWYLNGQLIDTTEDISALIAGTYQVILITTDGCFTSTIAIVHNTTVATNEPISSVWQLMPNPAHDFLEIRHTGLGLQQAELMLFDMLGRKIWAGNLSGNSNSLRLETRDFPVGLYQLIIQERYKTIVLPLIIQH